MKKWIIFISIFFILANLAGCETVRKKFTRKKKEAPKAPRIYQMKKYEKTPSPDLYKKHYSYWASWHTELVKVIGQNHKKDARCIEEIIGNLKDMQNILVSKKSDELQPHIDNLMRVRDTILKEDLSPINRDYLKRTLEREERFIKSQFNYSKVKDYLKKSFDEEPEE